MTRTKLRLRQEREQRGWSQEKVAGELGVDRVTVSRWERGISVPYPYYRAKLSALFGKDVQELGILDEDDEKDMFFQMSVSLPSAPSTLDVQQGPISDPGIPFSLISANRLIGRTRLLEDLKRGLLNQERSSVTVLQGLPGVGKTALAVTLTTHPDVQAHFSDGILWAGLGTNPNVIEVLNHWGTLLGVATKSMPHDLATWTQTVHNAIGQRRLLLVIDDVWQAAEALHLLIGGPNCIHVVTTRFPHIAAQMSEEDAFVVSELTEDEGVALLARFAPKIVESEPETACMLVRAVGCLPLALVLMGRYLRTQAYSGQPRRLHAAMQRLLDIEQRLRLSHRASSLEQSATSLRETSWSLQSAIALSDQQLNEQTRKALYALSVFPAKPNSFSEEAALSILQMPVEMLDALSDAGLLESTGPGRYTLHQMIADYAHAHLTDVTASQYMVRYFVQYVVLHEEDYTMIEREALNILAALEKAFEQKMNAELVRGVNAFTHFLYVRGHVLVKDLLQQAYHAAHSLADVRGTISTLLHIGEITMKQGDYSAAERALNEGLDLARENIDLKYISLLCVQVGDLARKRGDAELAEHFYQEGLILARKINAHASVGELLNSLSQLAFHRGNLKLAERYCREALSFAQYMKEHQRNYLLTSLGLCLCQQGDYAQAESFYKEALTIARNMGDTEKIALILGNLSWWASYQRDYTQAESYCQEALVLARHISYSDVTGFLLGTLGTLAGEQGNYVQAQSYFEEAFALIGQIGRHWLMMSLLNYWGEVQFKHQRIDESEQTFLEAVKYIPQGRQETIAMVRYNLARVAAAHGNSTRARRLGEESLAIFKVMGSRMVPEVNQWLDTLAETDMPAQGE